MNTKIIKVLDWQTIRKIILKRDNYRCQSCGRKSKEVHPKDGNGNNKRQKETNNSFKNLETLCHYCHMQADLKLYKGSFNKGKSKKETKRNKEIYQLSKSLSQVQVAEMFNLTRQRINQIVATF